MTAEIQLTAEDMPWVSCRQCVFAQIASIRTSIVPGQDRANRASGNDVEREGSLFGGSTA